MFGAGMCHGLMLLSFTVLLNRYLLCFVTRYCCCYCFGVRVCRCVGSAVLDPCLLLVFGIFVLFGMVCMMSWSGQVVCGSRGS